MRAIAKIISYATMHLTVAIAVAYALTRDWQIALGVGIIEPMVQTVAYTLHERLWAPKRRMGQPTIAAA
jgi:uncharacterized membrane protein